MIVIMAADSTPKDVEAVEKPFKIAGLRTHLPVKAACSEIWSGAKEAARSTGLFRSRESDFCIGACELDAAVAANHTTITLDRFPRWR